MAPLRTLHESCASIEVEVEICNAFIFQYKAQVPEQNTSLLYVRNWIPVLNRQFTELVRWIRRLKTST
ncbi:hypothetical protein T4B_7826 [Trichinella pseudospiralis]|uniref:Uncharacterized protein n=1 Tax=Trichinella pseudospiralis TaxID=6337 RepID=A0A0V1IMB4_TRIPS|nr:hypothetical protein T4A_11109 [Trichinella pseudospiralis]KRZ04429.1 hypothetical protein T4B_5720 [Trichinella pseudospiralis]KRZ06792.1 hypothetical protein T4B_7826 [Trichinella pseudospiralis]KRZ23954.1 hypothetical protein T4C_13303 [Trichinella pseudospiralis]KRZ24111.1 hypothetical protein T4C_8724 [Trichinella pseudospiralis]